MKRYVVTLGAIMCGLLILPAQTQAQTVSQRWVPLFGGISVGSHARLTTPRVTVTDGVVAEVGPTSLVVVSEGQEFTIPFGEVEAFEVQRTSVLKLALVGTVLGAAGGFAAKHKIEDKTCNLVACITHYNDTNKGLLIGAGVGLFLGAALGTRVKHWVQMIP